MKGKGLIAKNRELAFKTYCECGGNIEQTIRELKKKGLDVSKPTFYEWMKKLNFEERMKDIDAMKAQAEDIKANSKEKILVDLQRQKDRYDNYFAGIAPAIDNQAVFAYTNLTKTITDIQKGIDERPDLYRMTPIVMDEFVRFIKRVVADGAAQEQVFSLVDRFFDEVKPDGV